MTNPPTPPTPASLSDGSVSSRNSNPASGGCGGGRCDERGRDTMVEQAAKAIVKAANIYKKLDAEAISNGENYDDYVKVDLSAVGDFFRMEDLGDACCIAKRTVGKLKIVVFPDASEVLVRQVASGYKHGEAVSEVNREIGNAALPYSRARRGKAPFIAVGTDGMYGSTLISAPDITVRSVGLPNGQPTEASELGPRFFAEVEDGNRSLQELIRHLGTLLVNFPNLNGVLGIKGQQDENGNRLNALITIEWGIVAGVRQPQITNLVDFGPDPMSETLKNNANHTLSLPLPLPPGTRAVGGTHGAGVSAPLPGWTRFVDGEDPQGFPAIISIPPTALFGGACTTGTGDLIAIAVNAVPATVNLEQLANIYFP